ncbi:MAG: DUF368 domain-containing protein, partial [Planctomycetota bacterium]
MTDAPAPPPETEPTDAAVDASRGAPPAVAPLSVGLIIRGVFGGVLMGLANLVPGISGGTMLLAAGIYPRFIDAIAQVTTLRFRKDALFVLATVVGAALFAIVTGAGTIKSLVVDHRWVMYSLFIGLTLGGVPIIWRMVKPVGASVWAGFVFGFSTMAAVAWIQQANGNEVAADEAGFTMMLIAGVAGASAMILPGVSGGYLLLVLGVYVPILAGVDRFKDALKEMDPQALIEPTLAVVLPVGLGVLLGVVVVSNILKLLLDKCEKLTLGALLGLLFGAVVGLWPFQ